MPEANDYNAIQQPATLRATLEEVNQRVTKLPKSAQGGFRLSLAKASVDDVDRAVIVDEKGELFAKNLINKNREAAFAADNAPLGSIVEYTNGADSAFGVVVKTQKGEGQVIVRRASRQEVEKLAKMNPELPWIQAAPRKIKSLTLMDFLKKEVRPEQVVILNPAERIIFEVFNKIFGYKLDKGRSTEAFLGEYLTIVGLALLTLAIVWAIASI